jgi:hypothetical protein
VTLLRKQMTDELVRGNDSGETVSAYLRNVEQFARYFNRPPDQLGAGHFPLTTTRQRELLPSGPRIRS